MSALNRSKEVQNLELSFCFNLFNVSDIYVKTICIIKRTRCDLKNILLQFRIDKFVRNL